MCLVFKSGYGIHILGVFPENRPQTERSSDRHSGRQPGRLSARALRPTRESRPARPPDNGSRRDVVGVRTSGCYLAPLVTACGHLMSFLQQAVDKGGTDESGSAGDEGAHYQLISSSTVIMDGGNRFEAESAMMPRRVRHPRRAVTWSSVHYLTCGAAARALETSNPGHAATA